MHSVCDALVARCATVHETQRTPQVKRESYEAQSYTSSALIVTNSYLLSKLYVNISVLAPIYTNIFNLGVGLGLNFVCYKSFKNLFSVPSFPGHIHISSSLLFPLSLLQVVYQSLLPLYFPRNSDEELFAAMHLPLDVGNVDGEPVIAERQIRITAKPTLTPAGQCPL